MKKRALLSLGMAWCLAGLITGSALCQEAAKGTISGAIKDRDVGTPMKGMITFPGTDVPGVMSDSAGRYQAELAPGDYKVHIYANGYRWIERKITVTAGQAEKWDLTLKRRVVEVSGIVSDSASGRPLKALISITGSQSLQTESQAGDGGYRAEVKPGNYQIMFTAPGYPPASRSLSLRDKLPQKLDVKLSGQNTSASGKWQVFAGGGVIKLMGGVTSDADYGYMIRVGGGMDVGHGIMAGLSLGFGGNKLMENIWEPNYQLYQNSYINIEAEGRYKFSFWEKATPYVLVSAGVLSWQNNYDGAVYIDPATGEEQKAVSPIFRGGAGIEYCLTPKIFLWGQGRGGMFLPGDKITSGSYVKPNLLAEGSLGAGYRF
ncbi:MAG: carboxypeptidase regulatory-like domain-containing protein [Candidatus Edwardsbacteria bacterium]|nr:carboxypeptidase regulatory-like domain-containing protein [Candidatus Edwardsbacteria bacterium]MBU1577452.1 carboxypeptidase regulatory-like domain-containing protein [Candidatus Edwardsbacteria bacterium]MBU2464185.1 carboxypeptidase regulatory-like domain-containing protein [Candidatus Edwardsbacteria bacterium]MBU2593019.1 carboxypeptidase regulatory-like domain-containing protein [Candidatus Edwardsbacteria bacterium]